MSMQALEAAHLVDRLDRLSRSGVPVRGLNPAQWEALRYLARANRFSRTPAALSDYLASTRGTVSQTLIALEQKGFVRREPSCRDRRSVELSLTEGGREALAQDPLLALADDIATATGGEPAPLLAALKATLRQALVRNGGKPFGVCCACRHFRPGASGVAYHCALLDTPLTEEDSLAICAEQEEGGGIPAGLPGLSG